MNGASIVTSIAARVANIQTLYEARMIDSREAASLLGVADEHLPAAGTYADPKPDECECGGHVQAEGDA